MIIDTHGWINKKEHRGKYQSNIMDQSWQDTPDYSETRSVHQKTGIVGRYSSVEELVQMMDEAGVDKTLLHARDMPMEKYGQKTFYWGVKIPNEWNIKAAYIITPSGKKLQNLKNIIYTL